MDNGTETSLSLSSSKTLYTLISSTGIYPSNAAGIGMASSNSQSETYLYDCGQIIAYTPATSVSVTNNRYNLFASWINPQIKPLNFSEMMFGNIN